MKIVLAILYSAIGQIISYFAIQGSAKYKFLQQNMWLPILSGVVSTFFYILSVRNFVEFYNGELYPSRIYGFCIGIVVFITLSSLLFKEPLTPKNIVSIALCALIVFIQILWK